MFWTLLFLGLACGLLKIESNARIKCWCCARCSSSKWEWGQREVRQGRLDRCCARWYSASPVSCCTATDTAGCLVGGLPCLTGHLLQAGSAEKLAQSKTLGKKKREFIWLTCFCLLSLLVKVHHMRYQFPCSSRLHYLAPLAATWETRYYSHWFHLGSKILWRARFS